MHEELYDNCKGWEESSYNLTEIYNLVIEQLAAQNGLVLADIYSSEVGVDWVIDQDPCHPNDLGHKIIANKVFEAITRNCSFVARTMPKTSLIHEFGRKFGNDPERPYTMGKTKDIMVDKT